MKKICPLCGKEKELNRENFYWDKSRKSGFAGVCKVCKKKSMKSYVPVAQRRTDKGKDRPKSVSFDEVCFQESLRRDQGCATGCDRRIEHGVPLVGVE